MKRDKQASSSMSVKPKSGELHGFPLFVVETLRNY